MKKKEWKREYRRLSDQLLEQVNQTNKLRGMYLEEQRHRAHAEVFLKGVESNNAWLKNELERAFAEVDVLRAKVVELTGTGLDRKA